MKRRFFGVAVLMSDLHQPVTQIRNHDPVAMEAYFRVAKNLPLGGLILGNAEVGESFGGRVIQPPNRTVRVLTSEMPLRHHDGDSLVLPTVCNGTPAFDCRLAFLVGATQITKSSQ